MIQDNIYLTGFMASGKTTVGALLADELGRRFVDLDLAIAREAGLPVAGVFERYGEAYFRTLERRLLDRTAQESGLVVALGGGALCRPGAQASLGENALVVFLRVPPDVLLERLQAVDDQAPLQPTLITAGHGSEIHVVPRAVADRPILHDADGRALEGDALFARISDLLERRRAWYEAAHATVEGTGRPDEVVERIVQLLVATPGAS